MIWKIIKGLTRILLIVAISLGFLLSVLRNSGVQSYLGRLGSTYVSNYLGVSVWIDKIRIISFIHLNLENVVVNDHKNQPMITAKSIKVYYPLAQALRNKLLFGNITIDSALFNLVQYKGDDDLNLNILIDQIDSSTDTIENFPPSQGPFLLALRHLTLNNSRFVYYVETDSVDNSPYMNYEHLDISSINLEMEDIEVVDDSISAHIKTLSGTDRCGVVLKNLEGNAIVSSTTMVLTDAQLITPLSHANLNLTFNYQGWNSYLNFIEEVNMIADIQPSVLHMNDIVYFAPDIDGMENEVRLQGVVKGSIKNMKGKDLKLSFGNSTLFRGDAQMTGLPDIYETFVNLKVDDFVTDLSDLQAFNLPGHTSLDMIPQEIEKFGRIRLQGRFTGFYNDFVSNAQFYTDLGKLSTDVQIKNDPTKETLVYNGAFQGVGFRIGHFLEMESDLGVLDFDFRVKGEGMTLPTLNSQVDGKIDGLTFRGNHLETIFIDALISEKKFQGSLSIEDQLIEADFLGLIDFNDTKPAFDFSANFRHVMLGHLGLMPIDSSTNLSSKIHMDFTGATVDEFLGSITIDSTVLKYKNDLYDMDNMSVASFNVDQGGHRKTIELKSDFINGQITGLYQLDKLPSVFSGLLSTYLTRFGQGEIKETNVHQDFSFNFEINHTDELSDLFIPELRLHDTLTLRGSFNSLTQNLVTEIKTPEIDYQGIAFHKPDFRINTGPKAAHAKFYLHHMVFKEPEKDDSLRLGLDQLMFDIKIKNDSAYYHLDWLNLNQEVKNNGDIIGHAIIGDSNQYQISFQQADFVINDTSWTLAQPGRISIYDRTIVVDSLYFKSLQQSIVFDGVISDSLHKGFGMHFERFNVAALNIVTEPVGITLQGDLSGNFEILDVYNNFDFLANLKLTEFTLNGQFLGQADINSTYNIDQSIFLNINLQKQGNKGYFKPLFVEGYYYPNEETEQLDLDIALQNLSIDFLTPFLNEYVANIEGKATGGIRLTGSINEPNISGNLDLSRTQFRISYLNTLYSMSGNLILDNNRIGFDEITVYDTLGGSALLYGGLTHNRLKDFGVDLKVVPKNFVAMNTHKGMNELFYGKAIVDGEVLIDGSFDNVFLDIKATLRSGTDMHIPISTTLGVSENNFIVFVSTTDTSNLLPNKKYTPQVSNFSLNMDLTITNEAKVEISLPAQLGLIQAKGTGDLNMNLSRTGNFRMSGDYTVDNGQFLFKIRNLLNRKFELTEGGTISWTGNPYNGILGMNAKYQLKTSLSSLGLEQDSSFKSRVPVDCIIGLTGPIMNPNVKFRFDFPNATEEVKQFVFTKIDTTNASEMSQQMLSLLIFNSFSFNSGTGGNTSLANSVSGTSMQIVANQLSKWLSQISKDVDIGINYRPGGELTNEEVEVALSTQLFDERVTIDGNFGYQNIQNNTNSNTSNIVGDINVEVKITSDGRLRLKAFNRTNTVDLLDNTSPYTQGVGIFYRKEFNHLKELFQSQKQRERKRREEIEKRKLLTIKNEEELQIAPPK